MIRNSCRWTCLVATVLLAVSCFDPLSVPAPEDASLIPINISGSVRQVQTKATAEGFVDKDALGLYAVNYSENNTVAGVLSPSGNQADNVKYVFDEPNHKWVPVRPVYYKDVNTHVDLYLYYPYQNTISDVMAANFEVQKDQSAAATAASLSGYEASDWLWGKAEDIAPSETKVPVQLNHRLSSVQMTLVAGSGFEPGEFASMSKNVILTGTTRKATLDYTKGGVTPVGGAQLDGIVMCPQNDGTWRAVVIPQTVSGGTRLFSITIDGMSYAYSQSDAVDYQQGKQMNVTLTVNKKSPSGEYELQIASSQITDWMEDRNTHGGEARQYFVVNLTTPGTLQTTLETAGKNPAKIKNLKIAGVVNVNDFYFMRDQMTILEAVNMKECRIAEGGEERTHEWSNPHPGKADRIPDNAFNGKRSLIYFVFPDYVLEIGDWAFFETNLSGALIIPDMVTCIGQEAFYHTLIGSLHLSESLSIIKERAFEDCSSLTGDLLIPEFVRSMGDYTFSGCNFYGMLHLPESLEMIGDCAFEYCGQFNNTLVIPEKITDIPVRCFTGTSFLGTLDLNNVQTIEDGAFYGCGFSGDLIIPEGVVEIGMESFGANPFISVKFPSTLRRIHGMAFINCSITEPLVFPEGLVSIGNRAFAYLHYVPSIVFPSTLQTIETSAFENCYGISSIVCSAIEPPTIQSRVFAGVPKDNFTLEVPAQSVNRYRTEMGWNEFKRIAAHYEFSISRSLIQGLNSRFSRTLTLRVPSGFDWSVESKPDWITVEPSSGTGKTDVTISVSDMERTDFTFEVNMGSYDYPIFRGYAGRSGEVVFMLNEKEYTSTLLVEQYDSDITDGSVQVIQTHSQGTGIDIVFTGDGYSARDIAEGSFIKDALDGYRHFFDLEPYKTYKGYFNVYAVNAMSNESGIGTPNTIVDTKFGSLFTQNRLRCEDIDAVFEWANKANAGMDLTKSLVILLMNTSSYEGVTFMFTDGSALACCPVSTVPYPYDYRGIIQHEAGGHGFGKLGDEYIYHNAFIQNCDCLDGCEHPQGDDDIFTSYGVFKSMGWFKNLSMSSDPTRVPWAHLFYHPQYSDYVDVFEGGYMHSRGMYRSEATSCMNNNIPYYSAISRQAIVERIMYCAGETFSLDDFYAKDRNEFGTITKAVPINRYFGVDPGFHLGSGYGPILMGEHPNVK